MSNDAHLTLSVLCRNLYLGADFQLLCPAYSTLSLEQITTNFFRFVETTRYEERAATLAAEIEHYKPDVVCLQEVFDYRISAREQDVELYQCDFLTVLQNCLQALREEYTVAVVAAATSISLPLIWDKQAATLHIQDQVVILLRKGLRRLDVQAKTFHNHIILPLPHKNHRDETAMAVKRAYTCVDIPWQKQTIRIANTHLESISAEYQLDQACELADVLAAWEGPLLLCGDMNASPGGLVYQRFADDRPGGCFGDAFAGDNLNTWGCSADLQDSFMDCRMRIDHLLHRGPLAPVKTEVFGTEQKDRTPDSQLWPSDHAGIIGWYRLS